MRDPCVRVTKLGVERAVVTPDGVEGGEGAWGAEVGLAGSLPGTEQEHPEKEVRREVGVPEGGEGCCRQSPVIRSERREVL